MSWRIPLFKMYWDEEDVELVTDALKGGMNWAVGPNVARFEEALSEYLGVKYCATFNSGTSALHTALLAHGIGQGDEVIVPSFTFIATANAPLFVGAKPVFADIEEETLGLDPADVRRRISEKTKAIIPIHYAGCPCLIKQLRDIAQEYNLILIEDAAEALGASVNGRKMGTIGDSTVLSFCQNKVITTGEGGAVVTNSREIYERLKLIRSHGRLETSDYFSSQENMDYVTLGYNFRMSNITAALGLSQLGKVGKIIEMRRKIAGLMSQKLSNIKEIILPKPPEGFYHVYQMYTIRVRNGLRDELMKHLAEKGIMTKVYFSPVHQTHFYRNELKYSCKLPVTEDMSKEVLTLPMHPLLTGEEISCIVNEVVSFFKQRRIANGSQRNFSHNPY